MALAFTEPRGFILLPTARMGPLPCVRRDLGAPRSSQPRRMPGPGRDPHPCLLMSLRLQELEGESGGINRGNLPGGFGVWRVRFTK